MRFITKAAYFILSTIFAPCWAGDDGSKRRVVIRLAPGTNTETGRNFIITTPDVTMKHEFADIGVIAVEAPEASIPSLAALPGVLEVVDDPPIFLDYDECTDCERRALLQKQKQRSLSEIEPYGIEMVEADLAWREGFLGDGITVCIIDSGIDADHEDLLLVPKTGFTFTDENWNRDTCDHGTHIAGSVAAMKDNGVGIVGTAPEVELLIMDVFDDSEGTGFCGGTTTSDSVAAARKCQEEGADIINIAFGSVRDFEDWENDAYVAIRAQNVLVFASAGIDDSNEVSYPAGYDSVVSVTAVDGNKEVYSLAQTNNDIELSGPGVDVISTANNDDYRFFTGTSIATPYVSGVAALVWSSRLDADADEVLEAMQDSAEDLGSSGRDREYGYGLVQAKKAIRRLRINAVTNTVSSNERSMCFSSDATALVEGKEGAKSVVVAMKDIAVGDKVLTSSGQYKTVFTITHYHPTKEAQFLQVHTTTTTDDEETDNNNALELSPSHMIFVHDQVNPIPAMELKVGDMVQSLNGPREVTDIKVVTRNGLYNPITTDGTIVVDGIIASTYTSFTGTSTIDIAGYKLMSIQSILDMTIYPYRTFCMNTSLDLCNQHGEDELSTLVDFVRRFYVFWSQQHFLIQGALLAAYLACFCVTNLACSPFALILAALFLGRRMATARNQKTNNRHCKQL